MVDGGTVARHGLGQRPLDQAAIDTVCDTVLRQIGVDRGRTAADQHGEVMRVDTFGAAHVERAEGAQALTRQPAMHSTGGKDHGHGDAVFVLALIGQDQMPRTRTHGILGRMADTLKRFAQRILLAISGEGAVDDEMLGIEMADHRIELGIADERAFKHENLGLAAVLVQHVLEVAEPRLEAHHAVFAQAIDGRVRHLAEVLAEVMRQRAIHARQHGGRRIVTHRGQGLFPILGHGGEDLFQLFDGIARGHLTAAQLGAFEQGLFRRAIGFGGQIDDLADPFAKGAGGGKTIFHLGVMEQAPLGHIDGDHLARTKRAFFDHAGLVDGNHARLGPGDQKPVTRHHITHGAQAVAIKARADPAPIGHGKCGWAIPWLHHRVAIGIHILPRLRQLGRGVRPCLGDQHGFCHGRGTARADQNLEHGIERATVGCALRDDRFDILGHLTEIGGGHADLVALHPVGVALERVDLAVMGQHAEGLRQPPLRKGVGRIALVIDRECGLEPRIHQVGIEIGHILGQHHALVDDRAARQRTDIHLADASGLRRFLDPAADDVKLALEGLDIDALGVRDDNLLDLGAGSVGLVTQNADIDGHMAPAIDVVAHAQHFGFHDRAAGFLRTEIGARQEDLTDRHQLIHARFMAGATDLIVKELHRDLHMDARAIAGAAISIDRAAVPHGPQGVDAVVHHLPRGLAVDRHDKTHAAG